MDEFQFLLSNWTIYYIVGAPLTLGQCMTTRTKLVILRLLAGMFDLILIGAAMAFAYVLYGALANEAPLAYLSWPFAVGIFAWQSAAALKDRRQRVDYVDQLTERGYEQADAEAAWHITAGGGANLLRNLQQAELSDQVDRLERSINTPGTGGNSE